MSNLLPYAYARDFGLLARPGAIDGAPVEVLVAASTAPAAIAEVSRRFGQIQLTVLPRGELDAAIAGAYAGGGGDASQMADEFDADLDLTKLLQDVPAIEDLLESSDYAPVIRMINALLTQALREGASTSTSSRSSRRPSCVSASMAACATSCAPVSIHGSLMFAYQDHGAARHRREALAAGWPHHLARGRQTRRRARLDPAPGHGERAVLRLLDKEAGRLDLQHLGMMRAPCWRSSMA